MRNLFLLLLTFVSISPLGLLAQLPAIPMRLQAGKILGKSEYFVDYTYRHKTPAESKDFQEDIIRVELGKAFVKSYSYRLWQADSLLTQITNPNGTILTPEGGLSPFCYYRDLTNGTTQVYYRTPLSGPTLKYTDTPTFSWTLTGEKKVISGYEACHVPVPREKLRSLVYSQHPDLRWPELLWRPPWADPRAAQHGWNTSLRTRRPMSA